MTRILLKVVVLAFFFLSLQEWWGKTTTMTMVAVVTVNAFTPPLFLASPSRTRTRTRFIASLSTIDPPLHLRMVDGGGVGGGGVSETILLLLGPEQVAARTNFFIWAFGASGAAGVARSAFPRMYHNIREIQSYRNMEGMPQSVGDSDENTNKVGISPLCGYPRDLAVKDIEAIVGNRLSIDQIVAKYPVENNLWAKKGYITYQAFKQGNANVDPLAVRAIFDCFAQSTDVSNPEIAQAKLDRYNKESLDIFKSELLYSKLVGWAAIVTLLGLLGLADIEAFGFAYTGWFPDWPGGRTWLEGGLWDPETGLWSIPKYWI